MGINITVPTQGGGSFGAYLAEPKKGNGPGIVLLQEIFGVNQYIRDVADHYAEEGYVVMAPDLFWRLEPGVELTEAQFEKAFSLYGGVDPQKAVQDIGATIAALRTRPACNGRIGALGFCLGGALAYLSAAHCGVDCAVGYYGVGIEGMLDLAPRIACPLLLHFAAEDKFVPEAARNQVKAALAAKPLAEIHVYLGVDHAFARPGGHAYDEAAARTAHARSLALFRGSLGVGSKVDAPKTR
ncbi:MAG: dienelactone hydrolase family protein [Rhodospirillales bacterium]|nr:dienelactone hydrolase family protein [Rhodospirillales bacterium]